MRGKNKKLEERINEKLTDVMPEIVENIMKICSKNGIKGQEKNYALKNISGYLKTMSEICDINNFKFKEEEKIMKFAEFLNLISKNEIKNNTEFSMMNRKFLYKDGIVFDDNNSMMTFVICQRVLNEEIQIL